MSNEVYVWGIVIISWIIGCWIAYSLAKENNKLREDIKEIRGF